MSAGLGLGLPEINFPMHGVFLENCTKPMAVITLAWVSSKSKFSTLPLNVVFSESFSSCLISSATMVVNWVIFHVQLFNFSFQNRRNMIKSSALLLSEMFWLKDENKQLFDQCANSESRSVRSVFMLNRDQNPNLIEKILQSHLLARKSGDWGTRKMRVIYLGQD